MRPLLFSSLSPSPLPLAYLFLDSSMTVSHSLLVWPLFEVSFTTTCLPLAYLTRWRSSHLSSRLVALWPGAPACSSNLAFLSSSSSEAHIAVYRARGGAAATTSGCQTTYTSRVSVE